MKRNSYLAILAAMVLALAGFAFAQDGYFNPEIGNGKWSAAQVPVSPAYAQSEYFNPEIGNSPQAPSAVTVQRHAGQPGNLDITTATNLNGVTLKPGEYTVRHVDNGKEHFVEFSIMAENDFAPEGMTPYQPKVVARVNCTRKPLNAVSQRTELLPKTAGTTARLEIRGEKVMHLF